VIDFLIGYKEINYIINDMSYFIDGVRISYLCRIEDGTDTEGVYQGIFDVI
jgi:hypothetical protein